MPIVGFGFYTTSIGLLFCFPTLTIIEDKFFFFLIFCCCFFFFFCLFDILINSQADIKTHEIRYLWIWKWKIFCFVLFVLRLYVPVNNFSVMSGRSHRSWVFNQYFRGVKGLAQGHNTAAVGFEPPTSRSGVRHSTTEPPRSPIFKWKRLFFAEKLQTVFHGNMSDRD